MKSTAIHQHDDWFLIELPGYGDIPKDKIEVDINLTGDEFGALDYKALRGAMIMERYHEKRDREIVHEPDEELITAFDTKFRISGINSLDDIIKTL